MRFLFVFLWIPAICIAQDLKVTLDPSSQKLIDRNTSDGVSTIVFDSKVKNLIINVNAEYELLQLSENYFVFRVDTKKDIANYGYCSRIFSLQSPKSTVHREQLEIEPNSVYYYTVVLPEQYPHNLSFEYMYTPTAPYGVRIAYGQRIGFYLSYRWGEYKKTGINITSVLTDCDVTQAKELGYFRTAITAGLRLGVLNKTPANLYILLGGGYGEYGRQWENPLLIENNTYFYSDYIKGFEGEIACQCVLFDWTNISVGSNIIVGNGKISVDFQIGVGLNLNLGKLFNYKKDIL